MQLKKHVVAAEEGENGTLPWWFTNRIGNLREELARFCRVYILYFHRSARSAELKLDITYAKIGNSLARRRCYILTLGVRYLWFKKYDATFLKRFEIGNFNGQLLIGRQFWKRSTRWIERRSNYQIWLDAMSKNIAECQSKHKRMLDQCEQVRMASTLLNFVTSWSNWVFCDLD